VITESQQGKVNRNWNGDIGGRGNHRRILPSATRYGPWLLKKGREIKTNEKKKDTAFRTEKSSATSVFSKGGTSSSSLRTLIPINRGIRLASQREATLKRRTRPTLQEQFEGFTIIQCLGNTYGNSRHQ